MYMMGAAVPRDHSQLRARPGRRTLRDFKVKGDFDNIVVIDVECDRFPNVIIVDVPEPWQKKLRGSNALSGDEELPFVEVISIDDDEEDEDEEDEDEEDDDEEDDVCPPGIGVEGGTDFDTAATSGKKSNYASVSAHNNGNPVGVENRAFPQKSTLSSFKWKQDYHAKVPTRNHYGLDPESECGSSDSDCSDCELIDSSFDMFREQWEKASLKRRNGAHKVRCSMVDRASTSGCQSDGHSNFGGKYRTKQHKKTPIISGSSNENFEKGKQCAYFETSDGNLGDIASSSRTGCPCEESDENTDHVSLRCWPTEKTISTFPGTSVSNLRGAAQDSDVRPSIHEDIINDREKLKKTDEYKRAIEEEWESRQQQLQIQAEEAQRLKKRKKAETLRLLNIEKRQKQRVEEVRETQKKDEECMNMKEQLRVEITEELNRLEVMCINMASLLRSLGILVGGSVQPPTSDEVHAAYKRAVLRFHPDRASRMDIRQQVEAEEKFKLISRMKEKFLS